MEFNLSTIRCETMRQGSKRTRRTVLQTTAAGIAGALAGCSGVLGGGSGGGSGGGGTWSNLDADAGNSGANTGTSGPSSKPSETPMYEPSGFSGFSTVPLVNGSTVAVWGSDGALHAIDTGGSQRWQYSVEMDYNFTNVSPAMREGTVYLPTSGGDLVAVSAGERDWAISGPSGELYSPRVDDRGVYVGSTDSVGIYELDGTERWTKRGFEGDSTAPAVSDSHVITFSEVGGGIFSEGSWQVVARTLSDGSEAWRREGVIRGVAPVVADGTVYGLQATGNGGRRAVALSAADGSTQWTSDVLGPATGVTPAATSDAVYVATEGEIHALSADDGSALWDTPYTALDTITHSPRVDGDRVYVLLGNETVAAIDAATGEEVWTFGFEHSISFGGVSNLAVANGSLYASRDALVQLR